MGVEETSFMARIMASENVSLDGVFEDPETWAGPYQSEDLGAFLGEGMSTPNALMFGRVTYEKFAAFWPTADIEPFASKLNRSPKYVASTTLSDAPWGERGQARILKGNLTDEVTRLKQESDHDIVILGSGALVRSLISDKLLDELQILVHPVALGSGKRLFHDGGSTGLKLVDHRTFSGGVVMLTYQPA
jgi:dihydrofolate reductase